MVLFKRWAGRIASLPWAADVLSLAAGLVYLLLAIRYAHFMDVTMDEGTYLMKGLLYIKGIYTPFQDYGPLTNKMPLSYLIPGAAQAIFEPGLRTGRYFSIFLGLLMVLAIWLAARRLGGRWWAAAAVWALTGSLTNIMYFTIAISQVVTSCLLAWSFALTLGRQRSLWQLLAGGVFCALTVMVRQNMAPVVPLLVLYVFWEHGRRKGLWMMLAVIATLLFFHLLYWPNIMTIWRPYLPVSFRKLMPLLPQAMGAGGQPWARSYNFLTRLFVFWEGIRSNFPIFAGALLGWILWPRRKNWSSDERYKAAVILSVIYVILTALHMWVSIGKDECLYCYAGYLTFFYPAGILLVVVTVQEWMQKPGVLRVALVFLLILLFSTGIGYGAYQQLSDALMKIPVPRISNMQLQGGFTDLWRLLANKFGWSFESLQMMIPAAAGFLTGLGLLLLLGIYAFITRRQTGRLSPGYIGALAFFILGVLLSPGKIMAGWRSANLCSGDVIASHEAVGAHLAGLIPPGSLVYWENDISPLPLLYLPGVRIFPSQLNHWYTFLQGGDPDALERAGFWNAELASRWKKEADFLLMAERYVTARPAGDVQYDELSPSPETVPCRERSIIHIFRRVK